ncbi:MAG TPA: thiamine-phosphate kinase [Hyphomicrobium sp.]
MASDKIDSEEAIIGAFWAPLASSFPGAFGLQDDCAAITPPAGCDLVVTTDAVIAGVHFFADQEAGDIAWKALAVNVSDLVAKGASPLAYVMTLALPGAPERAWLAAFVEGLRTAQQAFGCQLVGGDTDRTPGPLSVSITAFGTVPTGGMVRRATASVGDLVYVSGTIGNAALGLSLRRDPEVAEPWGLTPAARGQLEASYLRPRPPMGLVPAVQACASAAMDVSDGLVKDFGRMCRASGAGGVIEAARVPLSQPAATAVARGGATLGDLLTGGEDYEVLATVAAERAGDYERAAEAAGTPVTRIGAIAEAAAGVRVIDAAGKDLAFAATGWDHFAN